MAVRVRWCWLFGLLASCAVDEGSPGSALSGREFVSESLEGRELVPGTEVRIRFRESELSASAGCNSLFGNYRWEDGVLSVSQLGMTEIGCDLPLHEQDAWLADFLMGHPTAELVEPRLTLSSSTETMTLLDREIASPDRPLIGTHWVGNGVGDGTAVMFGPGGDRATIDFGSDGRVEVFSGNEYGSGAFTAHETTIEFTDFAYSDVRCMDPTLTWLSDAFVFVLDGSEVTYEIEERSLAIERAGRTLYFRSAD